VASFPGSARAPRVLALAPRQRELFKARSAKQDATETC